MEEYEDVDISKLYELLLKGEEVVVTEHEKDHLRNLAAEDGVEIEVEQEDSRGKSWNVKRKTGERAELDKALTMEGKKRQEIKSFAQLTRAPRMEISPRLLEQIAETIKSGGIVVRSVELPSNGLPLKADIDVVMSPQNSPVEITGRLTLEKFKVNEVDGNIMLFATDEE